MSDRSDTDSRTRGAKTATAAIEGHFELHAAMRKLSDEIAAAAAMIADSLRRGGTLLLCGNGGSAADAQHIAAELVGRFLQDRRALPAIALTTNSSVLTALGNDFGFEGVFARQVAAQGKPGDALIAISTSGESENVLAAAVEAKQAGMKVIALTGAAGGRLANACDLCLRAPSHSTPRIQELHILIGHILCEIVEAELA